MRDQFGQVWAPWGLSWYDLASQQSVGASQGHSGTVRTTSDQYEYNLVYFETAFCFTNISAPYYRTEMVLYSEFTYGYQFSEETNGLEIRFLIPEILNKYKRSIFFETPCMWI